jgi:hypothetical protein
MDVNHVAQAVAYMAGLPLESNAPFITVMDKCPFLVGDARDAFGWARSVFITNAVSSRKGKMRACFLEEYSVWLFVATLRTFYHWSCTGRALGRRRN